MLLPLHWFIPAEDLTLQGGLQECNSRKKRWLYYNPSWKVSCLILQSTATLETCLLLGKNISRRALIYYPRIYLGNSKTQSNVRGKMQQRARGGCSFLALLTWRHKALVWNLRTLSSQWLGTKAHTIWLPPALIKHHQTLHQLICQWHSEPPESTILFKCYLKPGVNPGVLVKNQILCSSSPYFPSAISRKSTTLSM